MKTIAIGATFIVKGASAREALEVARAVAEVTRRRYATELRLDTIQGDSPLYGANDTSAALLDGTL